MRRRVASLALACLLATPALRAAPVEVRAGEHAGFSRLVLYLPRGADWALSQGDGRVSVSVPAANEGFTTRRVFDLIPRDRVSALETAPDQLDIALGCDCLASAEQLTSGHLVVDIWSRETAPPELLIAERVRNAALLTEPEPAPQPDPEPALEPAPEPAPEPERASVELPLTLAAPSANPAEDLGRFLSPERADQLDALRRNLVEEIGRAASQSLLEPRPDPLTATPPPAPPEPAPAQREAQPLPEPERAAQPRLAIRNAAAPDQVARADPPRDCAAPAHFDVASWGRLESWSADMAADRRKLYGEFDRIDRTAALAMARRYIFAGFSVEARLSVAQFDLDGPAAAALLRIADILDMRGEIPGDALAGMTECDPQIAIWAALAGSDAPISGELAREIPREFSRYPNHLRMMIGPPLIARLRARERDTEAEMLQAMIGRGRAEDFNPAYVTRRQIAELEFSDEELAQVTQHGAPAAPHALAALMSRRDLRGEPSTSEEIVLAESYAFELAGEPVAAQLDAQITRARARNGEVMRAYRDLPELAEEFREGVRDAVVAAALRAEEPDAKARLGWAIRQAAEIDALGAEDRLAFADFFASAGLSDLARDYLRGLSDAAALSLAMQIDALAGPDALGPSALLEVATSLDQGRGEALLIRADRFEEASELAPEAADGRRERLRFLGGAREGFAEDGTEARLAATLDRAELPPAPEAPLQLAQELITQSAATRDAVETFIRAEP